jgi:hypothetical protein
MHCQALGCLGRLAGGLEPFGLSLAQQQQVRFRWFKDKVENRSDFHTETSVVDPPPPLPLWIIVD